MGYPFRLLMEPPTPTYPEYPELLAEANRTAPRFVDPANIYPAVPVVHKRGDDWCTAVIGYPTDIRGYLKWTPVEHQLVILADAANIDPPLPEWIAEARAESTRWRADLERRKQEQRDRDADAWKRALEHATVKDLEVHEGSRARTRGSLHEPLRHVVPTVDVYSGTGRKLRVHRAGRGLCETENRRRLQLDGETTLPATCVNCLGWTSRVRAER